MVSELGRGLQPSLPCQSTLLTSLLWQTGKWPSLVAVHGHGAAGISDEEGIEALEEMSIHKGLDTFIVTQRH